MRCAQCHDHPFDVWTQDDYYGLAAFFAKVQRGGGMGPGDDGTETAITINPKGAGRSTCGPSSPSSRGCSTASP